MPRFPQSAISNSRPNWQDALKIVLYDHLQLIHTSYRPNWQDALKIVLYDHLQLVLETYTIPMYLTAAYSIKDSESGTKARNTITRIAKDEMFHLGLVGNMLCAIGGTPTLYDLTPQFPSTLFSTALNLTLAPATKKTIELFVAVEAPEGSSQTESDELLPTYQSIGEFYDGLEILLLQADGILNFQGASLFQSTSIPKQLTGYHGLFPIEDARSALKALKKIVEQGEGSSIGTEGSHWAFFKNIRDNYDLTYYDVVENIDSKNYTDESKFKFYPVMVASDAAYSFLLLTLDKLWQQPNDAKRKNIIDNNLKPSMSRVIGRLAKFLVKEQIPDSGTPPKYAGPPFRRHIFEKKPLDDLKEWMQRAAAAYPNDADLKAAKEQVDKFVDID